MIACRVAITGLVQGVSFRAGAKEEAGRLGVRGVICNAPDGSVEAIAEGAPDAVEAWISWCSVGPRGAQVTGMRTQSERVQRLAAFTIIPWPLPSASGATP